MTNNNLLKAFQHRAIRDAKDHFNWRSRRRAVYMQFEIPAVMYGQSARHFNTALRNTLANMLEWESYTVLMANDQRSVFVGAPAINEERAQRINDAILRVVSRHQGVQLRFSLRTQVIPFRNTPILSYTIEKPGLN